MLDLGANFSWVVPRRPANPSQARQVRRFIKSVRESGMKEKHALEAALWIFLHEPRKALKALQAAYTPLALAWKAQTYLILNSPQRALEVLPRKPSSPWVLTLRGESLIRTGKPEQALQALERCRRIDPGRPWPWMLLSEAHRNLRRYDEALEDLNELVRLQRGPWPHLIRARTRVNLLHDFQGGFADITAALKRWPECSAAYAYRAETFRKMGQFERSLKDFDRALNGGSVHPRFRAWRAGALRGLGRAREAAKELDSFIRRDKSFSWAWMERAYCRAEISDARGAFQDIARAVRLSPKYGWLPPLQSNSPEGAAKNAKIVSWLEKLCRNGRSSWAFAWLGETRLRLGQPEKALEVLEKAAAAAPKNAWARAWKGMALWRLGKKEEALIELKKSVSLDSGYAPAYEFLAESLAEKGTFSQARPIIERWKKLDPSSSRALLLSGICWIGQNKPSAALKDLKMAQQMEPSNRKIKLFLSRFGGKIR